MSVKGNFASLQQFTQDLRRIPRVVAQQVAKKAAPEITALAKQTFASSETPYGVPWAPGSEGQKVTLRKSGELERRIHYVAIGTKLRVALGVAYAKFHIGRRPVFPTQGGKLPLSYVAKLQQVAADVCRRAMRGELV